MMKICGFLYGIWTLTLKTQVGNPAFFPRQALRNVSQAQAAGIGEWNDADEDEEDEEGDVLHNQQC